MPPPPGGMAPPGMAPGMPPPPMGQQMPGGPSFGGYGAQYGAQVSSCQHSTSLAPLSLIQLSNHGHHCMLLLPELAMADTAVAPFLCLPCSTALQAMQLAETRLCTPPACSNWWSSLSR